MSQPERPQDNRANRILVVDDESSVRVLLVTVLTRAGYQVLAYEMAGPALAELKARPANLIIADKGLPGMDGIDLFLAARAIQPSIQGILITGDPSPESQAAAAQAGLREYVIKPFQLADILAVCEAAMKMAAGKDPG